MTPVTGPHGEALYLFCLARAGGVPAIGGAGIDPDRALRLVGLRDLVAVVSTVSMHEYCGPDADRRIASLDWVTPRASRHEAVIERVMRMSPVVPARFATLFSSHSALIAWIDANEADIRRALDRFAGREEWALKASARPAVVEATLLTEALARATPARSAGARYLEDQRIRVEVGRQVSARLTEWRDTIVRTCAAHAAECRERSLGANVPCDSAAVPLLNWAFLVPREDVAHFLASVEAMTEAFAPRGIDTVASGPWPPYTFCSTLTPA